MTSNHGIEISEYRISNIGNNEGELRIKYDKNSKTIREYETHLRLLLSILNETQMDYASQIQKSLEKLKYLVNENINCKKNLCLQLKQNEDMKSQIVVEKQEMEDLKTEIGIKPKGKIVLEKHQILSDISTLSSEIDEYSEKNNNYISILKSKNDPNYNNKILQEIEMYKRENEKLLNIINQVELNKVFNFQNEKPNSVFSCLSNTQDQLYSLDLGGH